MEPEARRQARQVRLQTPDPNLQAQRLRQHGLQLGPEQIRERQGKTEHPDQQTGRENPEQAQTHGAGDNGFQQTGHRG